jgi:DNA-binding NarL/FixJ family response regulator
VRFSSRVGKAAVHRVLFAARDPRAAGSVDTSRFNGLQLVPAPTLPDALEALPIGPWHGFVIDHGWTIGDEPTLLTAVRNQYPSAPVLVVGGASNIDVALRHGATIVSDPLPPCWLASFLTWVTTARRGSEAELRDRLCQLDLTAREVEVVATLAQGATAEMAGLRLGMSPKTVSYRCHTLYSRLGVASLTELLALANNWSA